MLAQTKLRTNAIHEGRRQLQAPENNYRPVAGAGPYESEALLQATKASNRCEHVCKSNICEHVCKLTQDHSSDASHKGKQQLRAQSKQLPSPGSHKVQLQRKP